MDRSLQHALAGLVTVLLVRAMFALPAQKGKPNTVELPRWMLILGLAVGVPALALAVYLMLHDEAVGCFVCLCLALLADSLTLAYCNCRVRYDEAGFTARSFLGFSRHYSYGDITGIQGKSGDVRILLGRHIVRLDTLAVGKDDFLAYARKQYRRQKGRAIPTVRPGDRAPGDFFRGNIANPEEMFFVCVIVPLAFLALIVVLCVQMRPKPADWETATVSFDRWELYSDQIRLYESGYEGVYALNRERLADKDALLAALERKESFELCFESFSGSKKSGPSRTIRSLQSVRGTVFLSYEDGLRAAWESCRSFAALMGFFALIMFAFFGTALAVGRHPERFKPKFVYLFFKPGWVLYDFKQQH